MSSAGQLGQRKGDLLFAPCKSQSFDTFSVTMAVHGFENDFKSSFEVSAALQLEIDLFAVL